MTSTVRRMFVGLLEGMRRVRAEEEGGLEEDLVHRFLALESFRLKASRVWVLRCVCLYASRKRRKSDGQNEM